MGQYCQLYQVQLRLAGKVRFTESAKDENLMPVALANLLISEAEAQLEFDLSERYATPFQTDGGQPFSQIPNLTTKNNIKTLAELQSVIRILETDFGRGTAVDGDKYKEKLVKRYDDWVAKLVERRKVDGQESMQWKYPPLPYLRLNWFNTAADDGYMGRVFVTGSQRGDFPEDQINSPSENFWNGHIDDLCNSDLGWVPTTGYGSEEP